MRVHLTLLLLLSFSDFSDSSSYSKAESSVRDLKTARFFGWLRENGADFSRVSLKESDIGLKLETRTSIAAGEILYSVPPALVLNFSTARSAGLEDLLGLVITDDLVALRDVPCNILTLFLASELLDENSFYRPYLDLLPSSGPRDLRFLPLYFSKFEVDLLRR